IVNTPGASQVVPNDPDVEDMHVFAITTPPLNGTATVDATGLVTYTPNPDFVGGDRLVVTVTDDGTPSLSGSVTIPVNVTQSSGGFLGGSLGVVNTLSSFSPKFDIHQGDPPTIPVGTIAFPGTVALLTSPRLTVRGTAYAQNRITKVAVNG